MRRYNPKEIEPKWQERWAEDKIYEASEDPAKPKRYVLEYFPYPSGAAMHVGHVRNYTIGDVVARHARMQGMNVLHPMGWDAFGLPAENYALKTGISPQQAIKENTGKFKEQLMRMGFSYDWSREFTSSDPDYYRWTQWFFLLLYKRGLAYRQESLQWWCPNDKTVLANEQVENGRCWRCGHEVEKKALKQWFFKITDYADRLAKDLDDVDWSDGIKQMQRNWIGRSTGAEITFQVASPVIPTKVEESSQQNGEDLSATLRSGRDDDVGESITVFTTRADTLYGATYMVVAPESPILEKIVPQSHKQQVSNYQQKARNKSDIERQETNREKTGVFTGAYAINPINDEKLPIWTADYVLSGYGTGAIMAVPAHDERDYAFAKQFKLPIKFVVEPTFGEAQGNDTQSEKVYVVLRNPKTNQVVVLDWGPRQKNYGGSMLIGGTVEGGEDHIETAKREIAEETGYANVKLVKEAEFKGHGYFYSNTKDLNVHASGKGFLFDLVDDTRDEHNLDEGEKDKFSVTWQPVERVAAMLDDGVHEAMFRYLVLDEPYTGEGAMINSRGYDGLSSNEARKQIVADLSKKGLDEEPTFVQTTEPGKVREGEPFVERQAITAIVKHWKEDKYVGLKWKKVDWDTLITGGIEAGQTAETAAIAEIREETGYLHPVLKKQLSNTHAKFFHVPKNENRWAHFSCLYFELADDARGEVSEDELGNHEVVWLTRQEMENFRLPESHRYTWNQLMGNVSGVAHEQVNYRMRDWLISRQRYWGAPIPMIHCPKDGIVPVPEDQLPVVLPELTKFEPSGDGRSPLANVPEFVNVTCPECGGPAERETDTMDGFACSSWYFLRFADPHNDQKAFDAEKAKFWLPVDDYIGGAEHAVMHLLYARMWTKVMQDEGLIDFGEPFKALRNQGMLLAPDGQKMSKSKGNTIQPDELIEQGYGADTIRIMELFIGPWNQSASWSVEGMGGSYRFLQRIWNLVHELSAKAESELVDEAAVRELQVVIHKTIHKVTADLENMSFNTAIAAMMECVNSFYDLKHKRLPFNAADRYWYPALRSLVQLLAPFAPHIAEEMWQELGGSGSVHLSTWPTYDPQYLVQDTLTIAVQVNGKLRGTISAPAGSDEAAATELAKADAKIAGYLEGKQVVKVIYIPGKLLNFVVK